MSYLSQPAASKDIRQAERKSNLTCLTMRFKLELEQKLGRAVVAELIHLGGGSFHSPRQKSVFQGSRQKKGQENSKKDLFSSVDRISLFTLNFTDTVQTFAEENIMNSSFSWYWSH